MKIQSEIFTYQRKRVVVWLILFTFKHSSKYLFKNSYSKISFKIIVKINYYFCLRMWLKIPSKQLIYKLTYQKISNPFIKNQSSIYLEFSNTVLKTKSVLKLLWKPLRNAQLIILLIKFWTQWLDQKEHTSTTVRVNGRIITDWGGQVFEKKKLQAKAPIRYGWDDYNKKEP